MSKINKQLDEFQSNGIKFLEKCTKNELSKLLLKANDAYHNESPLMTDNQYDILKEFIEKTDPSNKVVKKVGAPVPTKNKVKLPYEMASMDKIKPDTNALTNWMKKFDGPYLLSCKLDGVSGLYVTEGHEPKLYTRGDGKVGQDISHLIPLLKLPNHQNICVRGEFIIPKQIFEEKYAGEFANPRNLVAGIINSKTIDEDKICDVSFIAYELIEPLVESNNQMKMLKKMGHNVVQHKLIIELNNNVLSNILTQWRKECNYEIDGIIVCDDKIYQRKSGNPDHAFAFKMIISDQIIEAKVVDVIWSPSKDGYLKPRVQIEPIKLGGVTIEYATGFNGAFIKDNKIGIGAMIQISRAGDVIPYINSVIVPAAHAKMPDVAYKWNESGVDIIVENINEDMTVREKKISAFFAELGVEGLAIGNIKKIMKAGFNTISKILDMKKSDFEIVDGFKEKMVDKIYNGIKTKVEEADLLKIMVASNLLGRGMGERKLKPILEMYPNILVSDESDEDKIKMLKSVDGIGPENSKSFVANIQHFLDFLKECGLESKLDAEGGMSLSKKASLSETESIINKNNALFGKQIVMTKIRDKEIIEFLKTVGATLEEKMKKDTFILIVKSHDDVSVKTKYAEEHGIPILEPSEFKAQFM